MVKTLSNLLECVNEALDAHDSYPNLQESSLKWLWINEMSRHDVILQLAFEQLDKLDKCVRGVKVLDDHSHELAKLLAKGQVPNVWLPEDKTNFSLTAVNFIQIVRNRTEFFKVMIDNFRINTSVSMTNSYNIFQSINEFKTIPFDVVVKPLRLLTAIKFNYAKKNKINLQEVDFKVHFYDREEDLLEAKGEDGFGFTKLVLVGAKWDYMKQTLVEKNMMHEHETQLKYALFSPTLKSNLELNLINCPFYANTIRKSTKRPSALICYIPMQSDIAEHLVFKKGIMLAIDDQKRE